ncbi:Rab-GAP TBC domain-containing protein [Mycena kentingensis (nom. inval.)]|nr:Rab-GAP TBC domain-containing protein [Mycena kentingensis (nom. inval.)]
MDRPPPQALKQAYSKLFGPGATLSRVRDAALGDRLFSSDSLEVPGRSMAWKLFLLPDEPLAQAALHTQPTPPLRSLRSSRKQYSALLRKHLRAPDGSYEEGLVIPGTHISPEREASASNDLETNNPLSLHNENPWKEWFEAIETRKTILTDVERTYPEIAFFRDAEVQLQLTYILFIYSTVINPAVGYRQGMHELLAPLYYAVDLDAVENSADASLQELCARTWVAADAFALFTAVMQGASRWYEWQDSPAADKRVSPSPFATHVNIPAGGPVEIKPYVTPVVQDCNRIQHELLKTTDPLLWKQMQAAGIEPQIYGIRWLRLIYTREFPLATAMKLWDGLFACDPTLELAPWICVAMLIRIRNQLIPSDYSSQLTTLLRYPTQSGDEWAHHTSLLLKQALELQMSPTPATGSSIVLENRNLLNIPIEVPELPPPPQRRGVRKPEKPPVSSVPRPPTDLRHAAGAQAQQAQASLEGFARGLLERGENLGINRTLMNAVPEFRRNLSELAASFVRSPTNTSFPLVGDERPEEETPPWEVKSRRWYESHIEGLESSTKTRDGTNQKLADGLTWAVDVLLQDSAESKDPERLQRAKREALEAIAYVRDVLANNLTEIDDELLFGEEERRRRKLAAEQRSRSATVQVQQPAVPTPVPVIDSRPLVPPLAVSVNSSPRFSAPTTSAQSPTAPPVLVPGKYTRSSFDSAMPSASLPRIPPPTSSSFRRAPDAVPDRPRSPPPPRKRDSSSRHSLQGDPLGVWDHRP